MFKFGKTSLDRLHGCHENIRLIMHKAIETSPIDFTIVCGHRSKEDQNSAYASGHSKLRYPQSKHNKYPSLAVDVAPYANGALVWDNDDLWILLSEHIKETAKLMDICIVWGGDWKTFIDKPHFELKGA